LASFLQEIRLALLHAFFWVISLLLQPYQISETFDSKLADVGNLLVEQLCRHLHPPSVNLRPLIRENKDRQLVLVTCKVVADTLTCANWHFFGYPD
jgi:hypothetical protein